jgi:hypothetical protein
VPTLWTDTKGTERNEKMNRKGEKGEEVRRKTRKSEYSVPFSAYAPLRLVLLICTL